MNNISCKECRFLTKVHWGLFFCESPNVSAIIAPGKIDFRHNCYHFVSILFEERRFKLALYDKLINCEILPIFEKNL